MVGGAEQYLEAVAVEFGRQGHQVSLWHERSEPEDRRAVQFDGPSWNATGMGMEKSLDAMVAWKPEVTYCQGFERPDWMEATLGQVPGVFFAHNYHGTCVSGGKTQYFPVVRPCERRFGLSCLAQYYPHRCGGLSPVTMLRDYAMNLNRQRVLRQYGRLLTHSGSVRRDYERSGFECWQVPYGSQNSVSQEAVPHRAEGAVRLLFLGRLVTNKGTHVLLDALAGVAAGLGRPVELDVAGEGANRGALEQQARAVESQDGRVRVKFHGWVSGGDRDGLLEGADLLVVPSLWPEPFGLGGYEAGQYGVPSVGFAVGGIPDWLKDGVNGHLAEANPPNAQSLSEAIVRALRDQQHYLALRAGARAQAVKITLKDHCEALIPHLESVVRKGMKA